MKGRRWCSHSDWTGIERTTTSSSYPSSFGNVVIANGRGVSIAAYASAMRRGLRSVPGPSHGTPSASRNARAASVAASIPTSGRVRGEGHRRASFLSVTSLYVRNLRR